jgi:hypothetical protein
LTDLIALECAIFETQPSIAAIYINANMALAYLVVGDGLTGPAWMQATLAATTTIYCLIVHL